MTINIKRLLFINILFFVFVTGSNAQQKDQLFKLDFLNKIPTEIDGCSGLFTYDTTSLKKKRYIIVTDLQEFAFIKVNGKQIMLKQIQNKQLTKMTFKTIYKGDGYTIILTTTIGKKLDIEGSLEMGTLEILKESYKLLIKIHGESGC